jgi:hypothetical protein
MGIQALYIKKKALSFLLLVFFIVSVTATSASAANIQGSRDYKIGYQAGVQYGYKAGSDASHADCLKYGQKSVLSKIPHPVIKDNWTTNYKEGYIKGFKNGYVAGYNSVRFTCLKDQVNK